MDHCMRQGTRTRCGAAEERWVDGSSIGRQNLAITKNREVPLEIQSDRRARSLAMRDQPDIALVDVCLDGGRKGIEVGRWLREVCETAIVFVTACTDESTLERIHEQVPGAPVVSKLAYRNRLADAVAEVSEQKLH